MFNRRQRSQSGFDLSTRFPPRPGSGPRGPDRKRIPLPPGRGGGSSSRLRSASMTSSKVTDSPAWGAAKRRVRFHRAGVGRPRGQDRALFMDGEIGVVHHVARMSESGGRMEQRLDFRILRLPYKGVEFSYHALLVGYPIRGEDAHERKQASGDKYRCSHNKSPLASFPYGEKN